MVPESGRLFNPKPRQETSPNIEQSAARRVIHFVLQRDSATSEGRPAGHPQTTPCPRAASAKRTILLITPENEEINRFRKRQFNNFTQITMPYLAGFIDEARYQIRLVDEYNQRILYLVQWQKPREFCAPTHDSRRIVCGVHVVSTADLFMAFHRPANGRIADESVAQPHRKSRLQVGVLARIPPRADTEPVHHALRARLAGAGLVRAGLALVVFARGLAKPMEQPMGHSGQGRTIASVFFRISVFDSAAKRLPIFSITIVEHPAKGDPRDRGDPNRASYASP
jgi:hypothetical protein